MKLSGKTAIVTGGYRGLGLTIAKAYLSEGAKVAICGRSIENLKNLEETLKEYQGGYLWSVCDITVPLQVSNFIKKVLYEFKSVDILVNNAAIFGDNQKLVDYDPQVFRDVISVNLIGAFNMIQGVLPHMVEQDYGKIVNVTGSVSLEDESFHGGAYYASKLGLQAIGEVLASECTDSKLTSNGVNAAGIKQGGNNPFYDESKNRELISPDSVKDLFLYLASADSNGVNGKCFNVIDWAREHGQKSATPIPAS